MHTVMIQIIKVGTKSTRKIEMAHIEMVLMKSLKMEKLERMGKSISHVIFSCFLFNQCYFLFLFSDVRKLLIG